MTFTLLALGGLVLLAGAVRGCSALSTAGLAMMLGGIPIAMLEW